LHLECTFLSGKGEEETDWGVGRKGKFAEEGIGKVKGKLE